MKHIRNDKRGFSLVELLIAMAVFISLMAGLAVLFTGTMNTVRGSYQLLDAYEVGRSAIDRIDADLKGAFTSREHGDFYNFYGTPYGFMYVGTLEDGELGRVTYALHPDAETERFNTSIAESWQSVRNNVIWHAMHVTEGIDETFEAAENLIGPFFDARFAGTEEFDVEVTTYSLVRLEERGVTDLNTFQLPNGMQWPYIDPVNPNEDIVPGNESAEYALYAELVSAINPDPGLARGSDMRVLIQEFRNGVHRPYYLRGITTQTVEGLLAARKREIWIRMVGGERIGNMPPTWYNDRNPMQDTDPTIWPLNANDYVLAEDVLRRAVLRDPEGGGLLQFTYFGNTVLAEAVSVEGIFSYGDGADNYAAYFNAPVNVENYRTWWTSVASGDGDPAVLLHDELDKFVVDASTRGRRASEALGSPLLPRLPAIVGVDFSISREKTHAGAGDFRRKFTQFVDVPTAISGGEIRASIPNTKS